MLDYIFVTLLCYDMCGCETWSPYVKRATQAKGIRGQDPEENIWAQNGREWGKEKSSQSGTS